MSINMLTCMHGAHSDQGHLSNVPVGRQGAARFISWPGHSIEHKGLAVDGRFCQSFTSRPVGQLQSRHWNVNFAL